VESDKFSGATYILVASFTRNLKSDSASLSDDTTTVCTAYSLKTNFDFEEVESGRSHVGERRDVQTRVKFVLVRHVGPTEQS
jgi:hypothetical protein